MSILRTVRQNFRLHVNGPAVLYYPTDETRSNPEECLLVDISGPSGVSTVRLMPLCSSGREPEPSSSSPSSS